MDCMLSAFVALDVLKLQSEAAASCRNQRWSNCKILVREVIAECKKGRGSSKAALQHRESVRQRSKRNLQSRKHSLMPTKEKPRTRTGPR